MTHHSPATAHLTLDPATTDATLTMIYAALHLDPDRTPAQHRTRREAAAEMFAALHPRDPTEAARITPPWNVSAAPCSPTRRTTWQTVCTARPSRCSACPRT
jgi:hypothetical protein